MYTSGIHLYKSIQKTRLHITKEYMQCGRETVCVRERFTKNSLVQNVRDKWKRLCDKISKKNNNMEEMNGRETA